MDLTKLNEKNEGEKVVFQSKRSPEIKKHRERFEKMGSQKSNHNGVIFVSFTGNRGLGGKEYIRGAAKPCRASLDDLQAFGGKKGAELQTGNCCGNIAIPSQIQPRKTVK